MLGAFGSGMNYCVIDAGHTIDFVSNGEHEIGYIILVYHWHVVVSP